MEIRKSVRGDLEPIMAIVAQAQADLHSAGVEQWQNGYPDRQLIGNDIDSGVMYSVVCHNEVVAMAVISFDGEKTYRTIEGEWLNDRPYGVIHRIAVARSVKGQGVAGSLFDFAARLACQHGVEDLRIDTHNDNMAMRSAIAKWGFVYCGVITLESGAKRNAYQKILD